MQAYSIEFRESVAAARDDGMSTGEVVELFGCSASWARRLMQRRRDRGTLAPAQRTLPDQRALTDDDRERLREFIGRRPDATLAETIQALGLSVHPGTLSRTLDVMGLPRKKSPAGRPSRPARTCGRRGRSGSTSSPACGWTSSCSSTSSGPRPT